MTEVDLQSKIDGFLASSFKKFLVNDYNEAIRELKSAEVLDPENPEILYNLGINYCRLGLYKTAQSYFSTLLTMKHTFIDALEVKKILAYSLIHLEKYDESIAYLRQVLGLVPHDTAAINMKAFCLDMLGMSDEAQREYESILDIDKRNYNAYNSIAYIISKNGGDLNQALKYANAALSANKNHAPYLDTMGYVLMKMGKYDQAEHYLKAALDRAPLSDEIKSHLKELSRVKS